MDGTPWKAALSPSQGPHLSTPPSKHTQINYLVVPKCPFHLGPVTLWICRGQTLKSCGGASHTFPAHHPPSPLTFPSLLGLSSGLSSWPVSHLPSLPPFSHPGNIHCNPPPPPARTPTTQSPHCPLGRSKGLNESWGVSRRG